MNLAHDLTPTMPTTPMGLAPTPNPGGGSLVDATYGAPTLGAVTPISYNDPDLLNGGRSVTQEMLAFPFRGDAMVTAMLATGVDPVVLARDIRSADAQGIELLERILATPDKNPTFNLAVLDRFRNIGGFDTLRAAVLEHQQHPGRPAIVRSDDGGNNGPTDNGGRDDHGTAVTIMDRLLAQFPLSPNELKVREYDHAYRVVGDHEGNTVTGDRGSDLFVIDAGFTGVAVVDGGNVTRVKNVVHFDGPPRWIGPIHPNGTHRYSFVMLKIDDAGQIVGAVRSIHNHELEGSGLIGTQHLQLFEVVDTGLTIHDVLGVLVPVFALIPGAQLAAAVLSFANVGIRIVETGDLVGNLLPLAIASAGVVGGVAGATGNVALEQSANLVRNLGSGMQSILNANGDPLQLASGLNAILGAAGIVPGQTVQDTAVFLDIARTLRDGDFSPANLLSLIPEAVKLAKRHARPAPTATAPFDPQTATFGEPAVLPPGLFPTTTVWVDEISRPAPVPAAELLTIDDPFVGVLDLGLAVDTSIGLDISDPGDGSLTAIGGAGPDRLRGNPGLPKKGAPEFTPALPRELGCFASLDGGPGHAFDHLDGAGRPRNPSLVERERPHLVEES